MVVLFAYMWEPLFRQYLDECRHTGIARLCRGFYGPLAFEFIIKDAYKRKTKNDLVIAIAKASHESTDVQSACLITLNYGDNPNDAYIEYLCSHQRRGGYLLQNVLLFLKKHYGVEKKPIQVALTALGDIGVSKFYHKFGFVKNNIACKSDVENTKSDPKNGIGMSTCIRLDPLKRKKLGKLGKQRKKTWKARA